MTNLPEALDATLDILASGAAALEDPWWVFGGAAMVLAGLDDLPIPDVDVLASPRDARRLIAALGGAPVPESGKGMFRSRVFGQILTTPLPIDVMAEMDVHAGGHWVPVQFHTRLPVVAGGRTIHIPSVREQVEICRLFGRPKDLQRADRLEGRLRP